jgi:hypothetical protein
MILPFAHRHIEFFWRFLFALGLFAGMALLWLALIFTASLIALGHILKRQ